MDAAITNVTELQNEIIRLRIKKTEQEKDLKKHFNSPKAIFDTARSLYPVKNTSADFLGKQTGQDVFAWLSKLIIPIALNKTLFRKSNFIVKALVGLISQRASLLVNEKNVTGFWDKIKSHIPISLLDKLTSKKKAVTPGAFLSKKIATKN